MELGIVSLVHIHCQCWVFFGGCHAHVKGWHTFFKNKTGANIANIQNLSLCGMQGSILVVLCGPFTKDQRKMTYKKTTVRPNKVVEAFKWLKENNYHYANIEIPELDKIPIPKIIDEREEIDSSKPEIENRLTTTVVFPDTSLPQPTNGGFKTQEEFRNFVMECEKSGEWTSTLYAHPMPDALADYKGDSIAQAFPLLFPYGHSGLPGDAAIDKMKTAKARHLNKAAKRDRVSVLRKYLRHRQPNFHGPKFNLIVANLIMKETIFQSS